MSDRARRAPALRLQGPAPGAPAIHRPTSHVTRAFTFVEVMVVVVLIGILAAIVIPRFGNVTDEARTMALKSVAGGVRASIAAYRTRSVISGAPAYPTLAQVTTPGTVVESVIDENPFTGVSGVQAVSASQAASRAVLNPGQYGWNYHVDNTSTPPQAIFYANSDAETTATGSGGATLTANQL